MNAADAKVDGRRQRAERNEAAVIDALLDLYRAGRVQPSAAEIAARAGVSERTVFRLFDDLEALAAVTIERQIARVAPLLIELEPEGCRDERIAALVDQQLAIWDAVAPVFRVGQMRAPLSGAIRQGFERRWRRTRRQIERHFRAELDTLPEPDRAELVAALDAATSLEALHYLHAAHATRGVPVRAVLIRILRALLRDAWPEEEA